MGAERQRRGAQKAQKQVHSSKSRANSSESEQNSTSYSSLAAVAIIMLAIVLAAGFLTSRKHESIEDSSAEQESELEDEILDESKLEEKFASLMKGVDEKMLPSDPYEDFTDFETQEVEKEEKEKEKDEKKTFSNKISNQPNSKRPEIKRVDWWSEVLEKVSGVDHERIHVNPNVYTIPNLLSNADCYELIKVYEEIAKERKEKPDWCFRDQAWLQKELQKGNVRPGEIDYRNSPEGDVCVSGPLLGDVFVKRRKFHYSSTVLVPRGENALIDRIEEKLQERLGLPLVTSYHAQLIKYRGEEEYRPHTDCHNDPNDRLATIIIYLNDVKEGGHTEFGRLQNVSVEPKRGLGLLWNSLDSQGKCNQKTLHASGVLKKGVKYIFQRWFHQDQMLPSYDSEVVLCDNSRSCREYIFSAKTRQATKKMLKAEQLVSRNDLREALTLFQQAVEIQPNHSMSLIFGADVLARIERKPEALRWFKRALKLHPQHVDSNFIAAGILQDSGKLSQAAELLRTVTEVAPNDSDAFFNLGMMLADLDRLEEAANSLRRAAEIKPDDAEAHGELGAILADLGKEDEAEVYFRKAKELMKTTRKRAPQK